MNGREPDRDRALLSGLLVLIAISGLGMAVLAGNIALKDNGPWLSRILANLEPSRSREEAARPEPGVAARQSPDPPYAPTPKPAPKTDREVLRDIAKSVEDIEHRMLLAELTISAIKMRVERTKDDESGIDWIAAGTAVLFFLQAAIALVFMIFPQWRRKLLRRNI